MFSFMKSSRKSAAKLLTTFISLSTFFMAYKALTVISGTANPLTVVLSGSMEPAFARGDLLIIWGTSSPAVGDVVVYNVDNMPFPIVHRVIGTFVDEGQPKLLTKGDNNNVDDTGLYPAGQDYLSPDAVAGRVVGMIPFVGHITVAMSDYPWLRMVLFGFIALYTLLQEGKDDSCKVCSDRVESGDAEGPSSLEELPAHTAEDSCCASDEHKPEDPRVVIGGEAVFITESTDLSQLTESD
ncbi:Signal peptidase I [Colletotrichum karsti]|uniref:Signal peptidase complex catalytic subunit SEC11 n=1 Tax=Colletotrichum karsti TaxID=1095194 RepID=A0A9P6HZD7_9PEZI|nr:Signal peptidase I [Colletotrichum karsti]KAF9873439.1 Signal peptidase I [Colletotrichum karsti]